MYMLYRRDEEGGAWRYQYVKGVSLFGCNSGWVPYLVGRAAPDHQSEPYEWHFDVPTMLAETGRPGTTLVIDLKPKQRDENLSLYEVVEASGYSADGWTPVMLTLRGLFVDADPTEADRSDFRADWSKTHFPIFSMMYVVGTLENGELTGRWTPPGPTQSVIIWPKVMRHFSEKAHGAMNDGAST